MSASLSKSCLKTDLVRPGQEDNIGLSLFILILFVIVLIIVIAGTAAAQTAP